jgi:hypothetical protein
VTLGLYFIFALSLSLTGETLAAGTDGHQMGE